MGCFKTSSYLGVLATGFLLAISPAAVKSAEPTASRASPLGIQPFTHSPEFFPILPWDAYHDWKKPYRKITHGLESIAECSFNMAGFVKPADLPLCEKLGLAAIMAPAETAEPWFGEWEKLSDAEIDQRVRQLVGKTANNKAVLGYFIMDEPRVQAFPALAKAVAAVRKNAAGKLAYINLLPNYASAGPRETTSQLGVPSYTEYLDRYVSEVKPQFLSYDNYMVEYSDDLREESQATLYYSNLLQVRQLALKHRLPFWNIVCCNQIGPQTTIPSPASLAFQAYTTLAAGARGVSWYKFYQDGFAYGPVTNAGNKTETWLYVQTVNRQLRTLGPIMNRLNSTGVVFTSPPPVKSLPLLPGRVIKQVQSQPSAHTAGANLPVMVGEFTDAHGKDYVMIVNLSLEKSANVKLETIKPYKTKQVFSSADGTLLPLDEKNGHWLAAGQGVLITLQ